MKNEIEFKKHFILLLLIFTNSLLFGQGIFDRVNKAMKESQKKKGFSESQIEMIGNFNKYESEGNELKNSGAYNEAILKFNKAISIIESDSKVKNYVDGNNDIYFHRGNTYHKLALNGNIYKKETNYWNAIHDFKRYINANEYNSNAIYLSSSYLFRGMSYESINRNEQACSDYKNAKKLGMNRADDLMDELNCN